MFQAEQNISQLGSQVTQLDITLGARIDAHLQGYIVMFKKYRDEASAELRRVKRYMEALGKKLGIDLRPLNHE